MLFVCLTAIPTPARSASSAIKNPHQRSCFNILPGKLYNGASSAGGGFGTFVARLPTECQITLLQYATPVHRRQESWMMRASFQHTKELLIPIGISLTSAVSTLAWCCKRVYDAACKRSRRETPHYLFEGRVEGHVNLLHHQPLRACRHFDPHVTEHQGMGVHSGRQHETKDRHAVRP